MTVPHRGVKVTVTGEKTVNAKMYMYVLLASVAVSDQY